MAANTKRHGAPFRHMLFYGPPGTGKTLVAKRLARTSGCGVLCSLVGIRGGAEWGGCMAARGGREHSRFVAAAAAAAPLRDRPNPPRDHQPPNHPHRLPTTKPPPHY